MQSGVLPQNPFNLFQTWFDEYKSTGPREPTAMVLATASQNGMPSARVVLLKSYDASGFVFFTNYESRKSEEIASNPVGQLLFYWEPLARQVRIYGKLAKVSDAESDAYFQSREYLSQIGAWASSQSRSLKSRQELIDRVEEFKKKYGVGKVPRPPQWGGWRLTPQTFEFWNAQNNRLHDRYLYEKSTTSWTQSLLFP
jgi:pyridoxamine 5'-phosphate oxidase